MYIPRINTFIYTVYNSIRNMDSKRPRSVLLPSCDED